MAPGVAYTSVNHHNSSNNPPAHAFWLTQN